MSARILLVEDHPLNRELVIEVLEAQGHEVIVAVDVPDGRARLAGPRPDLVLMDIDLPGGGGELLLKEIRARKELDGLAVLAFTSFAMRGDEERLLAAGFDGYLSKPIDVRAFAGQVEAWLPAPSSS